jgi:hypothetical protein
MIRNLERDKKELKEKLNFYKVQHEALVFALNLALNDLQKDYNSHVMTECPCGCCARWSQEMSGKLATIKSALGKQ